MHDVSFSVAAPTEDVLRDQGAADLWSISKGPSFAQNGMAAWTHDGWPLKIRTVRDEYSRECLPIVVARRFRVTDVLETLAS